MKGFDQNRCHRKTVFFDNIYSLVTKAQTAVLKLQLIRYYIVKVV